jgi:uncharacterized membrane protein
VLAGASVNGQLIYNLGLTPDGSVLVPRAISDNGSVVVGNSQSFSDSTLYQAFRWSITDGAVTIPNLPGMNLGIASSISADGSKIFGTSVFRDVSNPRNNTSKAFLWTVETGIQDLLTGQNKTSASAVSANGETVVGNVGNTSYISSGSGGLLNLGVMPGGGYSHPVGVDSSGPIVFGNGDTWNGETGEGGDRAFRWTQADGMTNIDLPSGTEYFHATASSRNGLAMVGYGGGIDLPFEEGFKWTADGGMEALGSLSPGDVSTYPVAINFDGSVVVGNSTEAFIWTESGGMQALSDYLTSIGVDLSGWSSLGATAISSDGNAIAGTGTFNGETRRAFLVTGIPEPSSFSLLLAGGAVLMAGRRRRV